MNNELFTNEQKNIIDKLDLMGVNFLYYMHCEGGVVTGIIEKSELEFFWTNKELYIEMKAAQERAETYRVEKTPPKINKTKKNGFIYLVRERSDGQVKIGKTVDVNNRMKTFNVKLPFKVDIIYSFKCADYNLAESALHERFSEKRVEGEWFSLDDSDIELIMSSEFLLGLDIEVIK